MAKQKNPILSIGMIVKDEIRSIEHCLRALAPLRKALSCELVIADTGSSDGTREIAAEYADVLFDFEWINDFSAARNAVLEHCSGAWCLMVDADEYLDENIEGTVAFLKSTAAKHTDVCMVIQRNYTSWTLKEKECTDFMALRLFRLHSTLRYAGTIHEALQLSEKTVYGNLSSLILHHDGYAQQTSEEKESHRKRCDRNQKLLLEKLENGERNSPLLYLQLIESTCDAKGRTHACELAFQYFERKKSNTLSEVEKALACRLLSVWLIWKDERVLFFLQPILSQLEDQFLFQCDVSFHLSRYYEEKNDFEKTILYGLQYKKAIELYDKQEYEKRSISISSPSSVYSKDRLEQNLLLTRAFFKIGAQEKAQECWKSISFSALFLYEKLFYYSLKLLLEMEEFPFALEEAKSIFAEIDALEKGETKEQVFLVVGQLLLETLAIGQDGPTWNIFENAPVEFGLSVKIMRTKDVLQLELLLKEIKNWNNISAVALYHAIECRCPLPPQFYEYGFEPLQKLVSFFASQPNTADSLLCWASVCKDETSLCWVHFAFKYCALVLEKGGHSTNEYNALCRLFLRMADLLFVHLYHPDFLDCKAEWGVLPSFQHFALLLLLAKKALHGKHELEFIQLLQEAVHVASSMKEFVSHLSNWENHLAAFPPAEMEKLAIQIKHLLEQFPKGDDGVTQLKESDAYKLVAPLLESKYTL